MNVPLLYVALLFTFVVLVSASTRQHKEPSFVSCPPTAYIHGGCHRCVCATDGKWHCYAFTWCNTEHDVKQEKNECSPGTVYILYDLQCLCTSKGQWKRQICRDIYGNANMVLKQNKVFRKLRSIHAACKANELYLINCNVCLCSAYGLIEPSLCTARHCKAGHKANPCKVGDVLRTDNELCSCSDTNYYIDRQCIPITQNGMQIIDRKALKQIIPEVPLGNLTFNRLQHIQLKNEKSSSSAVTPKYDHVPIPAKIISQEKSTPSNYDLLPALRSGQICTPGKTYKVECNTCRCGANNILLCTKMACLDRGMLAALVKKKLLEQLKNKKHLGVRGGDKHQAKKQTELEERRHVQRAGHPQNTSEKRLLYPDLPVDDCKPGKIYQVGCNRCFCNTEKKAVCVEAECDDEVNLRLARVPKDVRPPFTKEETESLPFLSYSSAKCVPGGSYRVDCNTCLCLADGNTLCGDLLCVSHDDMNRISARQRSGAYCDSTTKMEKKGCVTCACLDGVQHCNAIPDCTADVLRTVDGDIPEALSANSGSCVPGSVYKEDCNRCYCQPDKSMRCTRKKCLSYLQVKKLKKLRQKLEKNGF